MKQATLQDARNLLWFHWGHAQFRAGQEEAIAAVLAERDVLAVLPTGAGKSVCYQIPALLRGGTTLVISPLLALMQDQVRGLHACGIAATSIDSSLTTYEVDRRWTDAEFGRFRLVYVSPERLHSDIFMARAARLPVTFVVIDEAHCVSTWGHQFRPAYRRIAEAYPLVGHPPVMAVTATATPEIRRDIVDGLGLRSPVAVVRGFDRPNILWSVVRTEAKREVVRAVLSRGAGSGVVYAATRRAVDTWAKWLGGAGYAAVAYHAGLAPDVRRKAQTAWLADQARFVVATSAFGMGIDKSDVRLVLHVGLPPSLEAYYQEAGRAGRDGMPAHAVLVYSGDDVALRRTMTVNSHPDRHHARAVYDAVCNNAQVAVGSLPASPVLLDFEAVSARTGFSHARIRSAVDLLVEQQVWHAIRPRKDSGLLCFTQSAGILGQYAYGVNNKALEQFVLSLLRHVPADAFNGWREVDLQKLANQLGLGRQRLEAGLDFLAQRSLLHWRGAQGAFQLRLRFPRTRATCH